MRGFRPFQVRLPPGDRYWTVVDSAYKVVPEADEWLLHVRLGRGLCGEHNGGVRQVARVVLRLVRRGQAGLGGGALPVGPICVLGAAL
jgi:hypothetical protein